LYPSSTVVYKTTQLPTLSSMFTIFEFLYLSRIWMVFHCCNLHLFNWIPLLIRIFLFLICLQIKWFLKLPCYYCTRGTLWYLRSSYNISYLN
jgi:hypothetical protein